MQNDEWVYVVVNDYRDESGFGYGIMTAFKAEIEADKFLLLLEKVNAKLPVNNEDGETHYRIQKVKLNG